MSSTPAGTVLILHNAVTHESPADARDILEQVAGVRDALTGFGYAAPTLPVDLGLDRLKAILRRDAPTAVFNLVEAIDDCGQLVCIVTALLDHLQVPYTGAGTEALLVTGNKVMAKQWLRANGIATADWWDGISPPPADPGPGPWMVKPVSEDASIGMDDASVVAGFREARALVAERTLARNFRWFAERFLEGREINVALIEGPRGPETLPIPEIEFVDYPAGKPRIVGYAAKWHEDSFEYRNTVRRFLDPAKESRLCRQLGDIALRCWEIFQIRGYARVDFRVDESGTPWVLEVNGNPCISPDAGLAAALAEAGISYAAGIRRIVDVARWG